MFLDEEDCLGFGVFVAELELVVGSSRDRKPDQAVLLELLQKLQASIAATAELAVLKQHQKRCEAALYNIILKAPCVAVGCPHPSLWSCSTTITAAPRPSLFHTLVPLVAATSCALQHAIGTQCLYPAPCIMSAGSGAGAQPCVWLPCSTVHQWGPAPAFFPGQRPAGPVAGQGQHNVRGGSCCTCLNTAWSGPVAPPRGMA